jgi:MFS family permease
MKVARRTPDLPQAAPGAMAVLLALVFVNLIGFGVVIPLLPFYATVFKAEAWQVTLLFSIFSAGQFIGELTWGRLSDRIGRRPVMLLTILLSAVGYVALAFAPTIWLAILARGAAGIFAGNISTIQGYIVDITPRERLAARLGLLGSAFGVGFVVGPAMGGLLAREDLGAAGFRPPLLLAAALSGVAAVGVVALLKESRIARPQRAKSNPFSALAASLRHPVLRILLTSTFISFAAFSAMWSVLGLWASARYGWGAREIGLVMGVTGVGAAISQGVLSGALSRRIGPGATIGVSLTFTAAALMIQALTPWAWVTIACVVVGVIGHATSQPASTSLVSRSAPPDAQGATLGAAGAVGSLARVTGPMFAGVLFSIVGPWAPIVFSSLAMLPAAWLGWRAAKALHVGLDA